MAALEPLQKKPVEAMKAENYDPFQEIMEKVGINGRFQKLYNLIFILALSGSGAMISMNSILALNVPDHWCSVPGMERTNFTIEQWRDITLPMEKDNRGVEKYSSCKMYDANFSSITDWANWNSSAEANVTTCQNGWSYDTSYYDSTISTQENWVCDKELYITNIYVMESFVEMAGSLTLGPLGDIIGRRIVYFISVICVITGRAVSIMVTSSYTLFLIFSGLACIAANSLFVAPQIVGMEISREEDRSLIAAYQSYGWSIGSSLMPIIFWIIRDWVWFMWLTVLPSFCILLFLKYVIESPRWLMEKRRFAEALVQFQKIAKINGRHLELTEKDLADLYVDTPPEKTYGFASLFSGWRLSRNTLIMGFSWCVVGVSYYTLVLFSSNIGGNPFLNFLLQTIVEVPAYILGKYLGDKYGRRFTNTISFLSAFLACIPILILITDAKYEIAVAVLASFIKFTNAVTYFTASLQNMEIYPTCMRQTGIGFGITLSSAVTMLSPYLVYLGTSVNIRVPYYILIILFFMATIGASFVPETLHKKLPDTLEEARNFGRHDKYFSLPKPLLETVDDKRETQPLNSSI